MNKSNRQKDNIEKFEIHKDGTENITSESWYAPMDFEITEVIGDIHQNPELIK